MVMSIKPRTLIFYPLCALNTEIISHYMGSQIRIHKEIATKAIHLYRAVFSFV